MLISKPTFRHTAPESFFEAGLLPDPEKEQLCRTLLEEFGMDVRRVREPDGEIIVPCRLPKSTHRNQDAEPTGGLNYKKLTYMCLGCNCSGGLLWFIAEMRDCRSLDARKWLEKQTGLGGEVMDLADLLRYFDALYDKKQDRKPPIPRYDTRVLDPWLKLHPYMFDPPAWNENGRNTGGRGVPVESLIHFKVGWDSKTDRIILPHFWGNDLVGWQSRRLANDGTQKYLSSPDFPKDQTIFNYDYMAQRVVVVEAMLSSIRHWHVDPHIESTFGATITARQVKLLSKHPEVVLFLDNDKAGWDAVEGKYDDKKRLVHEGLGSALSPYTRVLVVENPWAADPADVDEDTYANLVDSAVPYSVWERPTSLCLWVQNGGK